MPSCGSPTSTVEADRVHHQLRPWTAEDFANAAAVRKSLVNRLAAFMADYDVLATPPSTMPPFAVHAQRPEQVGGRIVDPFAWLSFTLPFN